MYQQTERLYVLCHPGAKPFFKNQPWPDSPCKGVGDVWRIPPAVGNSHNAPFPLSLARHVVRLWSQENALVCDPYSGSGTTMIASMLEGRNFIGSEQLKKYFDLSLNRLTDMELEHVS